MSPEVPFVAPRRARLPEGRGTIAAAFVRQALDAVRAQDVDPAEILGRNGLPEALPEDDRARVAPEIFGRLWLDIAARLDDELFALDRRSMRVGSFATLCRLMLHTPDLHTALRRGVRLLNLLLEDTHLQLEVIGSEAILSVDERGDRPQARRIFAHETLFVMLHGLMCWLVRRRIVIHEADFAYPAPAWSGEYLFIIGEVLHFERPTTRFVFRAADLEAPVVQDEATAREFLRDAPHSFILKYKDPQSVAARVRRLLRETPPEDWPRFADLARRLGRHPTTLRRRLEDEGSSYRQEKSARRRDLALAWLAEGRSVGEVAQALGFAEPSAFHRAFRQWAGVSPGEYRRRAVS